MGALLAVSPLVLALGWRTIYGVQLSTAATVLQLLTVQAVLLLPWSIRLFDEKVAFPKEKEIEMARSLGLSPMRAFWVIEGPRWKMAALSVFFFALSLGISELSLLHFFDPQGVEPLPLLLARLLRQYRFEEADRLALVLFLWVGGGIFLSSHFGRGAVVNGKQ